MIELVSGKQGSGKTLYATKEAIRYLKKGCKVYTNYFVKGCFVLPSNWYDFQYIEGSVIVFDEAQLIYNCRDFSIKDRQKEYKNLLAYLTMCRHYGIHIIFITQSLARLDVQIRDLATEVLRFKKTYKLPYLWIKNKKPCLRFLPLFSTGRYFDDVLDVDRYLNAPSRTMANEFGWRFIKLCSFKAMKSYDTHIIDEAYLKKKLIPDYLWSQNTLCQG